MRSQVFGTPFKLVCAYWSRTQSGSPVSEEQTRQTCHKHVDVLRRMMSKELSTTPRLPEDALGLTGGTEGDDEANRGQSWPLAPPNRVGMTGRHLDFSTKLTG